MTALVFSFLVEIIFDYGTSGESRWWCRRCIKSCMYRNSSKSCGAINSSQADMKMDFKLNVLTLNCWGIVGVSRHRKERMAAIASHIASSKYDFVFLQEIWSKDDYQMISKKCASVLPYSHYFYSGVTGSGLCILSKCSIVDSAQCHYTLNGFAHKVLHGDWFGGKLVGLCKVVYHGLKINLYTTHLHAEYDHLRDQYLPHRIVQAFEFSQFIKMTSESADLSLIAGDLNTESHHLAYQLIINNIGCADSYVEGCNDKDKEIVQATCGHPDNLYTSRQELQDFPNGKRIDYVMYRCGKGTTVKCLCSETPLKKVPNSVLPYSDHEAVVCELHIFKSNADGNDTYECNPSARLESLNGCREVLTKSIQELRNSRRFYVIIGFMAFIIMFCSMVVRLGNAYDILLRIMLTVSTAVFLFCFWMATIMNTIEHSALISCSNSMEILINSLVSEYGFELPVKPLNSHCDKRDSA